MSVTLRITGPWTTLLRDWLDQQGLDVPDLRARLLQWSREASVPVAAWRQLLTDAFTRRQCGPAPELAAGALIQPHHLGLLGHLILACSTLGEALQAYTRYERLFYGQTVVGHRIDGSRLKLYWPREATGMLGQRADGLAIAALTTFVRQQTGQPMPLQAVTFTGRVPSAADRQAYADFFQAPVQFGADEVALYCHVHLLALPMPQGNPALRATLGRQAEALLGDAPTGPVHQALRQWLPRLLMEGPVTLTDMARRLHLSPRTLQRRLGEERESGGWQAALDQCRLDLARHYLADPALSLGEVAFLLGFSEQSAFTRAFRHWTGLSPARWRRQHRS